MFVIFFPNEFVFLEVEKFSLMSLRFDFVIYNEFIPWQ